MDIEKPCPFCGQNTQIRENRQGPRKGLFSIGCKNPSCYAWEEGQIQKYTTVDEAISTWNRRIGAIRRINRIGRTPAQVEEELKNITVYEFCEKYGVTDTAVYNKLRRLREFRAARDAKAEARRAEEEKHTNDISQCSL